MHYFISCCQVQLNFSLSSFRDLAWSSRDLSFGLRTCWDYFFGVFSCCWSRSSESRSSSSSLNIESWIQACISGLGLTFINWKKSRCIYWCKRERLKWYGTVNITVSLHCEKTDTNASASHSAPVYSEVLLVLIMLIQGEMARLSWPGWLVTYRDGLPFCVWSPIQAIQVLTVPNVE